MLTLLFRPLLWLLKMPLALGKASKPAVSRVLRREGFTYGESYKEGDKTVIPLGHHPAGGEFERIANLEITSEYACLRPVDGWTQSALAILSALAPEGVARRIPGADRGESPSIEQPQEEPEQAGADEERPPQEPPQPGSGEERTP